MLTCTEALKVSGKGLCLTAHVKLTGVTRRHLVVPRPGTESIRMAQVSDQGLDGY